MENEQWFLRALRLELSLTQSEVGKAVGLTQGKISAFERGADKPTHDERRAIVDLFVRRAAVRGMEIWILERK